MRCPNAAGDGRGLTAGLPAVANTQGYFHGSLVVLRKGKAPAFVDGLQALTEFGAKQQHSGALMYPVAVHRAYFPETSGYEGSLAGDPVVELAESRLENANLWCEDADAK